MVGGASDEFGQPSHGPRPASTQWAIFGATTGTRWPFAASCASWTGQGLYVSATAIGSGARRLPLPEDDRALVEKWLGRRRLAGDVVLSFVSPARAKRVSRAPHVAIAEFESSVLLPQAVARLNQFDEVWNPSDWGTRSFCDSGVSAPVLTMRHGVSLERFCVPEREVRTGDEHRFLTVATFQPRKGYDVLFRAAACALGGRDSLAVVAHGAEKDQIRALARRCADEVGAQMDYRLELITHGVTQEELRAQFARADGFVLPTRGEGDGLPVREAMAAGLPVVATHAGPIAELLDDSIGYPITARAGARLPCDWGRTPPQHRNVPFFEPCCESLCSSLKRVKANPDEARAKAELGRRRVEDGRSWRTTTQMMLQALVARFGVGPIPRILMTRTPDFLIVRLDGLDATPGPSLPSLAHLASFAHTPDSAPSRMYLVRNTSDRWRCCQRVLLSLDMT